MNWRAITAIVRKDIRVLMRTRGVITPLIVVPLLFTVFFPIFFAMLPQLGDVMGISPSMNGVDAWLNRFPGGFRAAMSLYTERERIVVMMVVYYFAPMYLLLPMMVASVVAADSIAGEKERKTLEALLYTPTSDRDLLTAKLLAALLPALAVAWGGFIVYSVIVNLAAWPTFGRIFFPTGMWWILAFWVAPAVAGLGMGITVLISARVSTFQEAYQLGGLVVLPIVGLMVGQGAGALYVGPFLVFLLGLVAWSINGVLFVFGVRALRRSSLLLRM
jgi:ABC-type Na+ efflux pump permease subunit